MAFLVDLHMHTRRHSRCSAIDEHRLIEQAVQRGLDAIVITEHHYQWSEDEIAALKAASKHPDFLVMSAFEYSSARGDILIYGLEPGQVQEFVPGREPEEMLEKAQALGAACVAAHPTRAAISFDKRIYDMPFDGLEVASVNLRPHEQAQARKLAMTMGVPPTTSSDAHRLEDVGAYATAFDAPVRDMAELQECLKRGTFRPSLSGHRV